MADEVQSGVKTPQAPEPLTREEAAEKSDADMTGDERYVGVDPIYQNSAYEEPLEVSDRGKSKGSDSELEVLARVKENEAGCKVEQSEPVPYSEWRKTSPIAVRSSRIAGINEDHVKEDRATQESLLEDPDVVPPHSTTTGQPGVKPTV